MRKRTAAAVEREEEKQSEVSSPTEVIPDTAEGN